MNPLIYYPQSGCIRPGGNLAPAWVIDGVVVQERNVETVRSDGFICKSATETRRLYHCNFGWAGTADGYYFYDVFDTGAGPVDTDPGINEGGTNKSHYNRMIKILKYSR